MTWQEQALCRPGFLDPTMFDPRWLDEHASDAEHARAAEVCDVCPVKADCNAAAEDGRETGMVWAGRMRHGERDCLVCGEPTGGFGRLRCRKCVDAARPRNVVLVPLPPRPDDVPPGHCVECGRVLTGHQILYCSKRHSRQAELRRLRERTAAKQSQHTAEDGAAS